MEVPNVPNELNGAKDNFSRLTLETDANIDTAPTSATNTPENNNNRVVAKGQMHAVITVTMIALFAFIVVYGLFMQFWWLLAVLVLPLLRKAMIKIIDRYM